MTSRSYRLRNLDIRNVFHLIGEVIELGRNPESWRRHLLERLLVVIDARMGLAGEHFISPEAPRFVGLVEVGWTQEEQALFYSHVNSGGMAKDPIHAPVQKLLHRSFSRRRCDLVSEEAWYSAETTPIRRQCNIDDQIYSRWNLPQRNWAHVICPMRAWNAKPFTARDRLLVNLLHRELGRLWAQIDRGSLADLPPRLRQTLDLLFSGYSEKEMSEFLNVSVHTIHDFARRLYRHFNVNGRGQLLANPACRQLLFRPALTPAYYAHNLSEKISVLPPVSKAESNRFS